VRRQRIEWRNAIVLSGLSATVSLILFLMSEIIWGDIISETFSTGYQENFYSLINFVLVLGLLFTCGISFLVNVFIYREYTITSKILANLFTLALTIIIIYFIAFICVISLLAEEYAMLSIAQKLQLSFIFFAYFGVYVLPSPVWFWVLGLIIYHVILVFLIKLSYVKKRVRKKNKLAHLKPVYSNKNSMV